MEELHARLNDIGVTLEQRAHEEAERAQNLRNALGEMHALLDTLLERQPAESTPGDTSELVAIARQAAEHPRHLDYLSGLAEHAGEVADALEAQQAAASGDTSTRSSLERLRALLDELLG